jgi:acetate---CoA ligase (ADP-forming) subunit beta
LMFGLGGIFVEILHDTSYRFVPATKDELLSMVREVKGYPLLAGTRGHAAADIVSLVYILQAVAWLLTDFPEIIELDLNPVFTGPDGAFIADGRAVLAEKE